jgi:hypothetical protein
MGYGKIERKRKGGDVAKTETQPEGCFLVGRQDNMQPGGCLKWTIGLRSGLS